MRDYCFCVAGKDEEFPKKLLGQLPPDVAAAVLNHVGNGQSHAEPAEPPRNSSPVPDCQQDSRPQNREHQRERNTHSRGSNEIQNEQQKQSTTTTPEKRATPPLVPTPTPQITSVDVRKPHSHATANHNSNAGSSTHKNITPRWFKPSETKLEAVKAAAAWQNQLSRGTSPAPSSPDENVQLKRRPISKGFDHGADRGSNASQYDNVPGLLDQEFKILELDHPPSRERTPHNETSLNLSGQYHSSPNHGRSQDGSIVSISSGSRMTRNSPAPQFFHNSPAVVPGTYLGSQNLYPHQQSPRRTTTEVPILHPGYSVSLDQRGDNGLNGPYGFNSPSSVAYRELAYVTTQRQSSRVSPKKVFHSNSFATYRRQPPPGSNHNLQNTRSPTHIPLQLEPQSNSTPIYMQQLTSASQIHTIVNYRVEGHQRGEANLPDGRPVQAVGWEPEDPLPPQSPGGMPRSPSFQQAQLSPLQFTFPPTPDGQPHYRTQFQEQQPVGRQQLPQLFGAPHYRHAQEAFALQEAMLL